MTTRHSAVFDTLRNIRAALVVASWPAHPEQGTFPDVDYAVDESPDAANEQVAVLYRVEDDATIEWVTIPGTRDEKFLVEVRIVSDVPGQSRDEAWDRLEALAEVVQGVFYNPTTGEWVSPVGVPGTPGYYPLGGILQVTPQLFQTPEGWAGQCSVVVAVAARI